MLEVTINYWKQNRMFAEGVKGKGRNGYPKVEERERNGKYQQHWTNR